MTSITETVFTIKLRHLIIEVNHRDGAPVVLYHLGILLSDKDTFPSMCPFFTAENVGSCESKCLFRTHFRPRQTQITWILNII